MRLVVVSCLGSFAALAAADDWPQTPLAGQGLFEFAPHGMLAFEQNVEKAVTKY